jgi:hypothetical protein|tara:strand:+ start:812 stop:958 length:147 start_codon:yes stop_codon:yes gene_type:complete
MASRGVIGLGGGPMKKSKIRRKGRHSKVTPKREKKGPFRQWQDKARKG